MSGERDGFTAEAQRTQSSTEKSKERIGNKEAILHFLCVPLRPLRLCGAVFIRPIALLVVLAAHAGGAVADLAATIESVKPSVVVVGRYRPTASPRFALSGTGFAVGGGNWVVTNAHVVAAPAPPGTAPADAGDAALAVLVRVSKTELQQRPATLVDVDTEHDLALLRVDGAPLPALALRGPAPVREGQPVAFTGFPIGGVLGFSAVTHRGAISSITPVALPSPNARNLDERTLQRLRSGAFDIYQLDATAYPGNSGGPLFDPDTGEVLGVVNMVFVKGTKEAMLSQPSGITYAVPSRYVEALLQRQKGR